MDGLFRLGPRSTRRPSGSGVTLPQQSPRFTGPKPATTCESAETRPEVKPYSLFIYYSVPLDGSFSLSLFPSGLPDVKVNLHSLPSRLKIIIPEQGKERRGVPKSHTCALNTLGLIYCGDACSVNRSELDITGGTSVEGGGRSADQVHGPSRRPTGRLAGGFHSQGKVRINLQIGVRIARSRWGPPQRGAFPRSAPIGPETESEATDPSPQN